MKSIRLLTAALLVSIVMVLTGCGGGSSSSSSSVLDAETSADIDAAYTVLDSAKRASLTTLLSNTNDVDVQNAMTATKEARAGGLTTADISSARLDSIADTLDISTHTSVQARLNPYSNGSAKYLLYASLVNRLVTLRVNNPTVFQAYSTLVETIDDEELDAVVVVIERVEEVGFAEFDSVVDKEDLDKIVANVEQTSGESDGDTTGDDTGDTTGDDTGDTTGDNTGGTTGGDTGGTTGGDTGGTTGGDTGGTTGDNTGDTAAAVISTEVAEGLGGDGTEIVSQGSTTVEALDIASRVSVVDSTEEAGRIGSHSFARAMARVISDSDIDNWADEVDFNQDKTQVWVNDRSSESFGIINEILCSIAQTKYDAMVNAGPYIAQIDINLCEQNSAEGKQAKKSGEGSDNVTVPEYEYWVVKSVRADDNSAQVLYAWIPNEEEYGEGIYKESVIMARMVIYGDVDEYPPYGLFTMNFKQVPYIDGTKQIDPAAITTFEGTMKSFVNTDGENLIAFSLESSMDMPNEILDHFNIESSDEAIEMSEYVIMATSADGSAGRGATYMAESFPNMWDNSVTTLTMEEKSEIYNIAFNDAYFLREDVESETQACYERNSPKKNVYRYGLYDENGARVNLRSGLSIGFMNGEELYTGWAGFWGIHFDGFGNEEITALDGQVVNKFNWADYELDNTEAYTVQVYPGKLRKITRDVTTLSKVKNIQFSYWDDNTGNEYRIEWDGTGFLKSALRDPSNWTWDESEFEGVTEYLDVSQMQWPEIYVWSEALNGSVKFDLNGTSTNPEATPQCTAPNWDTVYTYNCAEALDGEVTVVIYKESVVMPGSAAADAAGALSFICYENCPDPNPADPNKPYFDTYSWDETTYEETWTPVTYTFDTTEMALQYGGVNVTVPAEMENGNIWSGALMQPGDQALLTCPWDDQKTCAWMAESRLDSFYRWESGSDTWNKLIALVNNGTGLVEDFEQPLSVEYEHTYADGETKTFVLNYEGFGNLHGIPETCEDGDTGEAIECPWWSGEEYEGWVRVISDFAIPAGAPASYFDPNTGADVDVVVKPLEEEHFMRANETTAACLNNGLSITNYSSQFLSLDDWKDPADYGMGEIPYDEMKADGGNGIEPSVIAGEIQ